MKHKTSEPVGWEFWGGYGQYYILVTKANYSPHVSTEGDQRGIAKQPSGRHRFEVMEHGKILIEERNAQYRGKMGA